jgi:hypothetical protein
MDMVLQHGHGHAEWTIPTQLYLHSHHALPSPPWLAMLNVGQGQLCLFQFKINKIDKLIGPSSLFGGSAGEDYVLYRS